MEDHLCAGQVAWDIDKDRAGAAGACNIEGLAERTRKVVGGLEQEGVLDHGHGDAHDIGLLECISADDAARDLAGDDHEGHGIHVGGGDARHRVSGTGAGGDQHHAHLAGGAGIAVCHVRGTLLVAGKHMVDLLGVVQRVVNLDGLAARVAKERIDALGLKAGDNSLGTGHGLALVLGFRAGTERTALDGGLPHRELFFECCHPIYAPLSALETSFAYLASTP